MCGRQHGIEENNEKTFNCIDDGGEKSFSSSRGVSGSHARLFQCTFAFREIRRSLFGTFGQRTRRRAHLPPI